MSVQVFYLLLCEIDLKVTCNDLASLSVGLRKVRDVDIVIFISGVDHICAQAYHGILGRNYLLLKKMKYFMSMF